MKATDFVVRERLGSIAAVEAMAATAHACYRWALQHDGLPPETRFAVFSADNPIVPFYERAMRQFWEMAAGCAVHGYTGLSMLNRDVFKRQRTA